MYSITKNIFQKLRGRGGKIDHLYLHIGAPKTGTTSIQNALFQSREHLAKEDILYPAMMPNHLFVASRFHQNPIKFPSNFSSGRNTATLIDAYHKKHFKNFDAQLKKRNWKKAIVSCESFTMYNLDAATDLRRYLQSIAERVQVICYVRHPLDAARSSAQQNIKIGEIVWSDLIEKDRFPKQLRFFRPERTLKSFIEAFGQENVVVRQFSRQSLIGQSSVVDILNVVGASKKCIDSVNDVSDNTSLTQEGAIVADALSRVYPRFVNGVFNSNRPPYGFTTNIPGRPFALPRQANQWVSEEAGNTLDFVSNVFSLRLEAGKPTQYVEMQHDSALHEFALNLFQNGKGFRRQPFVNFLKKNT